MNHVHAEGCRKASDPLATECNCADARIAEEHIFQFFRYFHLPEHLQVASRPFHALAFDIIMSLPRNPERTVALRKLLEAKDAAVRALLAK